VYIPKSVEVILGGRACAHSIYTKFVEIILGVRLSSISHSFNYASLGQEPFFQPFEKELCFSFDFWILVFCASLNIFKQVS